MKAKFFSTLMKVVIAAIAVFGVGLYGFAMPALINEFSLMLPFAQQAHFTLLWLIGISLSAIPCYAVLVLAWLMAESVKKDVPFSHKNAGRLKKMAVCALADGVYFFLLNIAFSFDGISHPSVLLASVLILLVAIAFAAVAEVLSGMVEKAALLQEENDLTI